MKALTIWQPWASLIHIGAKPFEFRGWYPPRKVIGERIVNHAAARPLNMNDVLRLIRHLESAHADIVAQTCLRPDLALPFLRDVRDHHIAVSTGAGLGSFVLGEPRNGIDIAEEFGLTRVNDSDRDRHANWGWPIVEYEAFEDPVKMNGRQGLWNWPDAQSVIEEFVT